MCSFTNSLSPLDREMNKSIFKFVEYYLIRLIFARVRRMEIFNLNYKQLKLPKKKILDIHKLARYIKLEKAKPMNKFDTDTV